MKDPAGLCQRCTPDDMIDFHYYKHFKGGQMQRKHNKEHGVYVDQIYVIADLTGLGWQHRDPNGLALMRMITKMDEDNFPEGLKKLFIINAPSVFSFLWSIVKVWLHANTLAKIEILGPDYQETIISALGKDVVPVLFGGNNSLSLPLGGLVEGYSSGNEEKTVDIARGDKFEARVLCDTRLSHLCWEISVADKDIGFRVERLDAGNKVVVVVGETRVDAAQGRVQGRVTVDASVIHTLVFDNSSALWHSKRVTFRTTLLPPDHAPATSSSS
eukprot:TRINITY_DN4270_c0_g1_i1.p1 TRINITY_DN4270_c0_g1~~TRINITY_DN4270_c0_g1_i1.p1  ORF type:complete len:317 (+),score=87.75 TRINITY_DN4270_c0_g1_i1:137-952(+)